MKLYNTILGLQFGEPVWKCWWLYRDFRWNVTHAIATNINGCGQRSNLIIDVIELIIIKQRLLFLARATMLYRVSQKKRPS